MWTVKNGDNEREFLTRVEAERAAWMTAIYLRQPVQIVSDDGEVYPIIPGRTDDGSSLK